MKRTFSALGVISLLLVLLPAAQAQQSSSNPFGVMMGGGTSELAAVAKDIGAKYVRNLVLVEEWDGSCGGCGPYVSNGMEVLLTARNNGSEGQPSSPPSDLDAYKTRLAEIIDFAQPRLLVVENEEMADTMYSGTPAQYAAQLQAACGVAHSKGVGCTNGGVHTPMAIKMVYIYYVDTGQRSKADAFARRASLNDDEYAALTNPYKESYVRQVAQKGFEFLKTYKAAGADFINFHWYRPDTQALSEVVAFLQGATGLKAMSNEMGQYDDDPTWTTAVMDKVLDLGLPYAVWFSLDYTVEANGLTTRALHNPDYSLRATGQAYRGVTQGLAPAKSAVIDLKSSVQTWGFSKTVTLYAKASGDAECANGRAMELQVAQVGGTIYKSLGTITTDASGTWTGSGPLRSQFQAKLVAPQTKACEASESNVVVVK